MKLITKAFVLGLAVAGTSVAACSTTPKSGPAIGSIERNVGTVGLKFTLPNGVTITSVHYVISGPTSTSGDVTIGTAQSVEFVVGGLLAGSYTITLTATDSAGDNCSSPATSFTITAGATTQAVVTLTCFQADGGIVLTDSGMGSVEVDAAVLFEAGTPTVCPALASLSVSPAEEQVGSTSAISTSTQPTGAAVTCSTSAPTDGTPAGSGTLNAACTVFTCTGAGQVILTVSTGTGPCPPSTMTAKINCEGEAGAGSSSSSGSSSSGGSSSSSSGSSSSGGSSSSSSGSSSGSSSSGGVADSGPDVADAGCTDHSNCTSFVQANAASLLPPGGTGHVCNQTETALYDKTVSGRPAGDCLQCAYLSGCLDDTFASTDINKECEDATATTDAGSTGVNECLATLGCDMALSAIPPVCNTTTTGAAPVWNTSTSQGQVNNAYCGIGVTTTTCTGTGTGQGPAGSCVSQITAGFPSGSNSTFILNQLTNPVYPSGLGNQLVSCLIANCKPGGANGVCFP